MKEALPNETMGNLISPHILNRNQKRIVDHLETIKKDYNLPVIYQGAVQVLGSRLIPDRFSLAAHGFRELIEKLNLTISSIVIDPNELRTRVNALHTEHRKVARPEESERCPDCEKLVHGKNFLTLFEKLNEFFDWFVSKPKAKDRYKDMLKSLDPSQISLPDASLDSSSKRLSELYGYFTIISHHRTKDLSEFDEKVATLESIMMNLFNPPTFAKHEEIDQIINEAEGNDH